MRENRDKNLPQSRIVKNVRGGNQLQKIGRPGYKVIKQLDPETGHKSLLFEIGYPEIAKDDKLDV